MTYALAGLDVNLFIAKETQQLANVIRTASQNASIEQNWAFIRAGKRQSVRFVDFGGVQFQGLQSPNALRE